MVDDRTHIVDMSIAPVCPPRCAEGTKVKLRSREGENMNTQPAICFETFMVYDGQ